MLGVAVVVPTRNRAGYLREALESARRVEAALGGIEIVVVDQQSTDETSMVCRALGVRMIDNPGKGAGAGRNAGVAATTAPLIAFLDDDDVWLPGHVAHHVKALESTGAAVAFSRGYLTDSRLSGRSGPYPELPLPKGDALRWALANTVQPSTMVVRREAFEAVGCFDESLVSAEDCDLTLRLAQRFDFVGIDEPTVLWRQHPRQLPSFDAWLIRHRQVWPMFRRRFREPGREPVGALDVLRAYVKRRGWHATSTLTAAEQCAAEGRTVEARRFLFGALRSSPPHCLKAKRFWRAALRAL